jgi:SAM-dependent methyltransferase
MNVEMNKIQQEHGPVHSWLVMWETKNTPWNIGQPALALQKLLNEKVIPETGQCIVPGCGEGHDCFALANGKRIVYGVDLSPLVIQQNIAKRNQMPKDLGIDESNLKFIAGDFFQMDKELETGSFDFLMDYTFLCALQPDMRPSWAKELKRLLKSGAMLVTLMYPLSDHEGGPPFALSEDIYRDLLSDAFELQSIQDSPTIERRQGKEKLGIWKRK